MLFEKEKMRIIKNPPNARIARPRYDKSYLGHFADSHEYQVISTLAQSARGRKILKAAAHRRRKSR